MNNDRELLELAARANGAKTFVVCALNITWIDGNVSIWNPLTNDSDALQLASNLHMQIDVREHSSEAHIRESSKWPFEFFSDHGGNKTAATRRAITRAAAEIGKAMG